MNIVAVISCIIISARLSVGMVSEAPGSIVYLSTACCNGNFTVSQVLRDTKFSISSRETPYIRIVRERDHVAQYGTNSHASAAAQQQICLDEAQQNNGIAHIVQSLSGASISLWNPLKSSYEKQTLWGVDPLELDADTRLVYIGPSRAIVGGKMAPVVAAWATTTGAVDTAHAQQAIAKIKRIFGISSVELYLGSNPYFWGTDGFPWIVPAFGSGSSSAACLGAKRRFLFCTAFNDDSHLRCW